MLRWLKISFNVLIIAATLILTFSWFRKNDAFVLKEVRIRGNHVITREEILELAQVDFSQEIFQLETDAIKNRIMSHPMVESASVHRFLPSTLQIYVSERKLLAAVTGSELSAIDANGFIITQFPASAVYDLPVITGFSFRTSSDNERKPNQPELLREVFFLIKNLKSVDLALYHEISEVHYHSSAGVVIYFKNSRQSVIFGKDDFQRKVIYFSHIYHHLMKLKLLDQALAIDVRFQNQVVVKNKS